VVDIPSPLTPEEAEAALIGNGVADPALGAIRAVPDPVPASVLPLPARRVDEYSEPGVAQRLAGYRPEGAPILGVRPLMDPDLEVPPRIASVSNDPSVRRATTVFAPEDRKVFSDTTFPWRTLGRVDTAGGFSSGVLVGPRHVLTASHAIPWGAAGAGAGWLRFTPSYFDGNEPFGHADAIKYYSYKQVTPPTIDGDEGRFDFAVVVLGTRLGDQLGWMGARGYVDGWDGKALWNHVGYPFDVAAGKRPTFQSAVALDGSDSEPDTNEVINHRGDVFGGQSGGPFFAWWSGEAFPRVTAVQSWENSSTNGASGGGWITTLIDQAKAEFP
jgi:V8-like Glu-specific endopeptidase